MIASSEKKWLLWFAIVFMLVTMLPYVLGYFVEGKDWRYSGLLIAVEDGNSYIGKMRLGTSGDWLFRTPYTPFRQSGFLAFLPYILLGKLAAPPATHEQLVALFHLFRLVGGGVYLYGTYIFLSNFIQEINLRRWGTILAAAGGGLGFLSLVGLGAMWGDRLPLEYYSPETFGFLSLLALPHLAAGRGLLLLGLSSYLQAGKELSPLRQGVKAGFLWLGLGLMQPLTVVIAWGIVGTHLLFGVILRRLRKLERQEWNSFFLKAVGMGLSSLPIVLYTFLSFQFDPFLQAWQTQNIISSPPITDYLLAYGPALVLASIGIYAYIRKSEWIHLLPVGWVLIFPLLAYAPYNLQRRLPEGVWVAILCLALVSVGSFRRIGRRIGLAGLATGILPALTLFLGGIAGVMAPSRPLFRPTGEVEMFEFLEKIAPKGVVVMAAYDTSNALPAWVPVRTLIGHGPESIRLQEIRPRVEIAYSDPLNDNGRLALIDEFEVDYILFGPDEQSQGGWDPERATYLRQVYIVGDYQVYEVDR